MPLSNSSENAMRAKEKVRALLNGMPGINGIGIAWNAAGELCVRVNVLKTITRTDRSRIPAEVDGVHVQVETIGEVRLQRS